MSQDQNEARNSTYKMIFIGTGLTGLVTIVILGAAIAIGLFLDNNFGSDNHIFTVISVIVSIPLTIMGLLWTAKFTANRYGIKTQKKDEIEQEDA